MDTITIFCASDDFCKKFEPRWEQCLLESSLKRRRQQAALCLSEVMTIMVGCLICLVTERLSTII